MENVGGVSLQIPMRPFEAIEGGIDAAGTPFLLVQAFLEGKGWLPGKVVAGSPTADVCWGFQAFKTREFRILVWAD